MSNYTVALVKNGDYVITVSYIDERRKKEILDYYGGCKVLFLLNTCDRGSYLSARIKCECAELRDMAAHHNKLLKVINGSVVENETYHLCCEVQKAKMNTIGRLVRRLVCRVNNGMERFERSVKDEIALQCYDLLMKEIEAADTYRKVTNNLMEEYHRSLVNAYC